MINKFNLDELKSNIDGIKSIVSKPKSYKDIKIKTLDKYIEISEEKTINVSIDVRVGIDEDGKEIIIDSKNIDQIISGIATTVLKYSSSDMVFPKNIIVSSKTDLLDKMEYMNIKEEYKDIDLSAIDIKSPVYSMSQLVINENVKKSIDRILSVSKNKYNIIKKFNIQDSLRGESAILCNFYGVSGTGKNCVIHAIAKELNKLVMTVNYNILESIPIENIPKTIKSIFEIANKKNAIVIIEESDRLIKESDTDLNNYYNRIVNLIKSFIKIETKKFNSLVFFTSTYNEKIDEFFRRRFFINVEFKLPNEIEREKLWDLALKNNVNLSPLIDCKTLAQKYQNISRSDIKDIIFIAASISLENNRDVLYEVDFDIAYNQILGNF